MKRSPKRSMVAAMRSISVASTPRPIMFDIADLPQPNGAFDWVQAAAGPALVCRPLADHARHLFTTRHWPLGRDRQSWVEVAAGLELPDSRLARVRQVHGSAVVQAREATNPSAAMLDA